MNETVEDAAKCRLVAARIEREMYFVSCTNWGDGPNGSSPAYTRGGFVYKICPDMQASVNNGNLQSYTELNGGPGYPGFLQFNQSYSYDALNRLTGVNDSGGYVRNFQYDAWGNMGVSNSNGVPLSGTTPLTSNNPFNTATNRLVSANYDAVGNQLNVGSVGLGYDAESRQVRSQDGNNPGVSYRYDGEGRRVSKAVDGGATTVYVYDALGKLISEYTNAAGNVTPPCWVCFPSYDHLGSVRMMTGHDGGIVSRHDYLPFGEEVFSPAAGRDSRFGANDLATQRFTGTEADAESRLNFFQARYFGGTLGRFTSPDPGNAGADPSNPQSWNGYSYVLNNPLRLIDPSGLASCAPGSYNNCVDVTATQDSIDPATFCFFYGCGSGGSSDGGLSERTLSPPPPPLVYHPQLVQPTAANNGTNNNCVAGYAAAGAALGARAGWLGGGAAAVLGTAAGPADIAIAYGGKVLSSAVGTYVGQQAGQLVGSVVCSSSTGGGGGAGGGHRDKIRGANANDKQQIRNVAQQEGVDARRFGDWVEEEKVAEGRGPSDNYTYGELKRLAQLYKTGGGR